MENLRQASNPGLDIMSMDNQAIMELIQRNDTAKQLYLELVNQYGGDNAMALKSFKSAIHDAMDSVIDSEPEIVNEQAPVAEESNLLMDVMNQADSARQYNATNDVDYNNLMGEDSLNALVDSISSAKGMKRTY